MILFCSPLPLPFAAAFWKGACLNGQISGSLYCLSWPALVITPLAGYIIDRRGAAWLPGPRSALGQTEQAESSKTEATTYRLVHRPHWASDLVRVLAPLDLELNRTAVWELESQRRPPPCLGRGESVPNLSSSRGTALVAQTIIDTEAQTAFGLQMSVAYECH